MTHTINLVSVGATLDVRHNSQGEATYILIPSNGRRVKFFKTLEGLICNVYFGQPAEFFHCKQEDAAYLWESDKYSYEDLEYMHENRPNPNQLQIQWP